MGANNARGECYYQIGEYDKAISDFSKAIENMKSEDPSAYALSIAYCYESRADAYEKIGKPLLALGDRAEAQQWRNKS